MSALAADPSGGRLGIDLPRGHIVPDTAGAPALWLSDGHVDGHGLAALHAQAPRLGLRPVLLNLEGFVQPVEPDRPEHPFEPDEVLARWTARRPGPAPGHEFDGCETCEAAAGIPRSLPGASFAAERDRDPAETAAAVAHGQLAHAPYLGLVAAARSADILTALSWDGPANRGEEIGRYAAVLGRWEECWGARVVALSGAFLVCSAARPPRTMDQAVELALEHQAFCPDYAGPGEPISRYAASLLDASVWTFWWD